MKPRNIEILKKATNIIVGVSAASVVNAIIRSNTNPETTAQKAAVGIGSFALGGMVADKAAEWTDAQIDDLVSASKEIKDELQSDPQ